MWQYGVMASLISKFIIDKDRMDPKMQEKIREITHEIKDYSDLVNSLDVHNPLTWVNTASSIVNKFYNDGNVVHVQNNDEIMEEILEDNQLCYFADFDLLQCIHVLIDNYDYKFYDLWDADEDGVDAKAGTSYIKPGFYVFEVDGAKIGCQYSTYSDKTYYIPNEYDTKSFEEKRKYFLDVMTDVSSLIWRDRDCFMLSNKEGFTGYSEVNLQFVDLSDYKYFGPLENLKDRWPKYRDAGIRRTAIFQGPPGTGKTTLCYWLANNISKRTLLFDSNYLMDATNKDIADIIMFLRPEMIVMNDVHYMSLDRLQTALSLFEEGATELDVPYIVCTSNDLSMIPAPLQRPGRLGDESYIIDEIPMNIEVRNKILKGFEQKVKYQIPDNFREYFLRAYQESGEPEAFLVELLKRAKVEGEQVLLKHLQEIWEKK